MAINGIRCLPIRHCAYENQSPTFKDEILCKVNHLCKCEKIIFKTRYGRVVGKFENV